MSRGPVSRAAVQGRGLAWALSFLCVAAVGLALVAQYAFDLRPCPWCVLQRGLYLLMAVAFAVAAIGAGQPALRSAAWVAALLLSLAGAASALYQHLVAAQQFSCKLTIADKVISALQLDALVPQVFSATASCAEAAVSVAGVPFAYWSMGLFAMLGSASLWALLRRP